MVSFKIDERCDEVEIGQKELQKKLEMKKKELLDNQLKKFQS